MEFITNQNLDIEGPFYLVLDWTDKEIWVSNGTDVAGVNSGEVNVFAMSTILNLSKVQNVVNENIIPLANILQKRFSFSRGWCYGKDSLFEDEYGETIDSEDLLRKIEKMAICDFPER